MKRSTLEIIIGVAVILILVVGALIIGLNSGAEWGGADGGAADMIDGTGYTPWYESVLWAPPSGEIESLLFALQAAFGAGVACFIFGYWVGQSRGRKEEEKKE